jgi:hypothetical protein
MKNFRCEKNYHEKPRIDVGICRGFDFLVEAIFLKYFGSNETELTTLVFSLIYEIKHCFLSQKKISDHFQLNLGF